MFFQALYPFNHLNFLFICLNTWEQRKFQDVVEVAYQGINTTADKVEYVNKGVPILQGKHITSGKIDYKDVRYLDKEKYEPIYYPKYVPKANDILLANDK